MLKLRINVLIFQSYSAHAQQTCHLGYLSKLTITCHLWYHNLDRLSQMSLQWPLELPMPLRQCASGYLSSSRLSFLSSLPQHIYAHMHTGAHTVHTRRPLHTWKVRPVQRPRCYKWPCVTSSGPALAIHTADGTVRWCFAHVYSLPVHLV